MPGLLAALSLVALAAEPAPVRWQADDQACPSAAEVEARLRSLLGARTLELSAEVDVVRATPGWRAHLRMRWHGHLDEQTVEAPDCNTVADATMLMVAAMADPLTTSRATRVPTPEPLQFPPTPTPTDAPTDAPTTNPIAPPRTPTPSTPPESRDRGPSVALGTLVDRGSVPGFAVGPTVALGWQTPSLGLKLEGLYLPPTSVASTAPYATSARVQLGAARLRTCVRLGGTRVELPLCALAEGGVVGASRFGEQADRSALDPWLALGPTAGIRVALGSRLALNARLETLIPLTRGQYGYDGDILHLTEPLVVRAALALEFHWAIQIGPQPENQ